MEPLSKLFRSYPWASPFAERVVHILTLIVLILIFLKLTRFVSKKILQHQMKPDRPFLRSEREKRLATIVRLIETTLRVFLIGAAFMMILREIGLDITPLLTGAGIAGLAVGFGSQNLVKDVISGFLILVEDQVRVGDVVKIGNFSGTVERMELRITAIRDSDGALHVIPNGEIKTVSNMTHGFANAVVVIYAPYTLDLKKVSDVLGIIIADLENDPQWKEHLRGKPELLSITDFSPGHMKIEVSVKTIPHSRWLIAREIRRRIKLAFDSAGIALSGAS